MEPVRVGIGKVCQMTNAPDEGVADNDSKVTSVYENLIRYDLPNGAAQTMQLSKTGDKVVFKSVNPYRSYHIVSIGQDGYLSDVTACGLSDTSCTNSSTSSQIDVSAARILFGSAGAMDITLSEFEQKNYDTFLKALILATCPDALTSHYEFVRGVF